MKLPIDLSAVNWEYVGILAVIVFIAALLGNIVRNRFVGAIVAGILFAIAFVFYTYYPHGLPLPLSPK
jgi:dolichyl-phosphate-mannose--protein O-mannosyl transferase